MGDPKRSGYKKKRKAPPNRHMKAKNMKKNDENQEENMNETASSAKLSSSFSSKQQTVSDNTNVFTEEISGNRIIDVSFLLKFIWKFVKCPNPDCQMDSNTGFGGSNSVAGEFHCFVHSFIDHF